MPPTNRSCNLLVAGDKSGVSERRLYRQLIKKADDTVRFVSRSAERGEEDKMTTLTERLDKLTPARRKRVEARAKVLIAEEMSLQDLRKARKQTQVRVAKELGDQPGERLAYRKA